MTYVARSTSGLIVYCRCGGCTGPSIRLGGEWTRRQSCLLMAQTSGNNWQTVPKAPSPGQSRVIGTQGASAATDLVGTHLPSRALLWDLREVPRGACGTHPPPLPVHQAGQCPGLSLPCSGKPRSGRGGGCHRFPGYGGPQPINPHPRDGNGVMGGREVEVGEGDRRPRIYQNVASATPKRCTSPDTGVSSLGGGRRYSVLTPGE
ncbi:hypothetical protein chiPu_0022969 [Chiloscyllium punctatum]|uniref:Uncharacterized protein n=1 Tax=Chiloscyllium punctatum TaxID=137246 RepID=A0A401T863_CHIPU|nr:hypothetical protein [Chiloscyllium punctatum]